jgi:hypothetical protein
VTLPLAANALIIVTEHGGRILPEAFVLCFENTSKEAALAGLIFENRIWL